jgi:hypothetical protein
MLLEAELLREEQVRKSVNLLTAYKIFEDAFQQNEGDWPQLLMSSYSGKSSRNGENIPIFICRGPCEQREAQLRIAAQVMRDFLFNHISSTLFKVRMGRRYQRQP